MTTITAAEREMGLVKRARARSTGIEVEVWRPMTLVDDPGWVTVCEHGASCHHETRALAMSFSAEPEAWCEQGCREAAAERTGSCVHCGAAGHHANGMAI